MSGRQGGFQERAGPGEEAGAKRGKEVAEPARGGGANRGEERFLGSARPRPLFPYAPLWTRSNTKSHTHTHTHTLFKSSHSSVTEKQG